LSGQKNALFQLYKNLPIAVKDYLNSIEKSEFVKENSALDEIKTETKTSKRTILDQITFENYSYYLGFNKL
ncbi:MAG: Eco47II family restriction endonuclease, partial [Lutibacter sp.]